METTASEISISSKEGVKIVSLGSYSLEYVEERARIEALKYEVRCTPERDSEEVLRKRTEEIAKRDAIGDFERIGVNQWQHKEALKFIREGGENTYAIYSDRDMAKRYYSID